MSIISLHFLQKFPQFVQTFSYIRQHFFSNIFQNFPKLRLKIFSEFEHNFVKICSKFYHNNLSIFPIAVENSLTFSSNFLKFFGNIRTTRQFNSISYLKRIKYAFLTTRYKMADSRTTEFLINRN